MIEYENRITVTIPNGRYIWHPWMAKRICNILSEKLKKEYPNVTVRKGGRHYKFINKIIVIPSHWYCSFDHKYSWSVGSLGREEHIIRYLIGWAIREAKKDCPDRFFYGCA